MRNGRVEQYRGPLTPAQIADGMNAAARNAKRLVEDATLLLDNGRYPSALSMSALSIEESGKVNILRGLSIVPDEKALKSAWRNYRSHTAKNAAWIIVELALNGAKTLNDLRPMFDPASDHPNVLDSLKQIGFYTDCLGNQHWSEPHDIIEQELATSILAVAKLLVPKRVFGEREIELWIEHVGPHWGTLEMQHAAYRYHEALRAEGLDNHDPAELRRFYGVSD